MFIVMIIAKGAWYQPPDTGEQTGDYREFWEFQLRVQSAAPSLPAGASPAWGSDFKPNYFILVQVPKLSRTWAPTVLTLLCFVSTGGNLVICHIGGLNHGVRQCYGVGNGFHEVGF